MRINLYTLKNHIKLKYLVSFLLFIIPFFWFSSDKYILGDDDTGLSYYYIYGSLEKFITLWYSSDSLSNYGPLVGGELVFSFILLLLNYLTFGNFNLQQFALGFLLSMSFLYCVKVMELINNAKNKTAYVIGALFYVLSGYFVFVEYYYLMPSTYVILLTPIITFYLFKATLLKRMHYVLIPAIWSFIFSRSITTPVFINSVALIFIFNLLFFLIRTKLRDIYYVLKVFVSFILCVLLINSIIFIPLIYGFFTPGSNSVNQIFEDRQSNSKAIMRNFEKEMGIPKANDALLNILPKEVATGQGFKNYLLYDSYDKFLQLNYIFTIIILIVLIRVSIKDKVKLLTLIIIFLISFLFLIVDIFPLFNVFYAYLITYNPIFGINRYPALKFHIPFIFYYSLLIGSVLYLINIRYKKYSLTINLLLFVILVIVNYPLLSGYVYRNSVSFDGTSRAMDFSAEYKIMADEINNYINDDSNLLLFPLGYGYGAFIQGSKFDEVYRSTMTGFKNMTGYDLIGNLKSIGSVLNPSLSEYANEYYFKNANNKLLAFTEIVNIKYIIYTKDTGVFDSYSSEVPDKYTYKRDDYYDIVNTDKPIYQNDKYVIYKLKNYNNISQFKISDKNARLSFLKISDFLYLVKLNTTSNATIFFHEPYSEKWKLYDISKDEFDCKEEVNYAKNYPNIKECSHINSNLQGNLKIINKLIAKPLPHTTKLANNRFSNSWNINTRGQDKYIAVFMDGQRFLLFGAFVSVAVFIIFISIILKKYYEKN